MVQHEPVGQATFVKRWPEGATSPLRMTAYRVATYGRSNGARMARVVRPAIQKKEWQL